MSKITVRGLSQSLTVTQGPVIIGNSGSITAADITDSSATGRAVLTGDVVAGRAALGISDTVDVKDIEGIEGTGYALLIAESKAEARTILQLGSASLLDVAASGDATAGQVVKGSDSRLTNDRTASGLRTATTVVSVSAATAPSAGQTLVATSSTAATWQTPASGGISAADLAGGTLPASLTTLATSGVASLSGLTLGSAANPSLTITYEDYAASLSFRFANQDRVRLDLFGLNLNQDGSITWSGGGSQATNRNLQLSRTGENRMGLGSYSAGNNDAALELGAVRKKPYTVGTLPVAPSAYDQCLVVDALAPAIGSAVVGGGGVAVNVIWISPNWMVI